MTTLLKMLNEADVLPVLCLIAILAVVGNKMSEADAAVRQWGRRLAGVGFAAYSVYAGLTFHASDEDDWLHIVIRAVLAGGLMMGAAWIVLSILFFLGRCLKSAFSSATGGLRSAAIRNREEEQDRRRQEAQQRRALEDADRQAQQQRAAFRQADDSRRRADARMRCLTLYDRHAMALAERFPRERLQEYFDGYMGDSSAADVVEERGRSLASLIEQWVEQDRSREKKRFQSLGELATFFQKQRDEVEELSYDRDIKESLVCNINIQEELALRRFLS